MEIHQDPAYIKSHSGYAIIFMDYILTSTSKLQTQNKVSAVRADYIVLSLAMCVSWLQLANPAQHWQKHIVGMKWHYYIQNHIKDFW